MTQLTVTQVAQMVGVSKRTIQNKIKQGFLSASRACNNHYNVDLSEVLRVYPDANIRANTDENTNEIRESNVSNEKDLIRLETENKLLKEQISMLKDQLNKSEDREKKLLDTVSTTTKLIQHDKAKKKRFLGIF